MDGRTGRRTLKNKGFGPVFSIETALYLHGLMEHEPTRIFVSVKRGYNATHLIKSGIKPYSIKEYISSQKKNGHRLMVYAKLLGVELNNCSAVYQKEFALLLIQASPHPLLIAFHN